MPFVRFSRDKRGYEHIYLVHASNRRGKPSRSRVLYWYRTPPGVRVGREPFDVGARRLLEAQYPDLTFDWEALAATPIPPPPEIEPWRERRRAERAARRPVEPEGEVDAQTAEERPEAVEPEEALDAPEAPVEAVDALTTSGEAADGPAASVEQVVQATTIRPAHRRRRGGRRRRRPSETAGT